MVSCVAHLGSGLSAHAPLVQDALGKPTIIVSRRSRGSAITRWMLLSSSSFISTRVARTRNVSVSKPGRRPKPRRPAGAGRRAQAPDSGDPGSEVDLARTRIGQRLDAPALDAACDLPRVGRRRLCRKGARPHKCGDHQPKESRLPRLATSTFPPNLNDCPLWTGMASVSGPGRWWQWVAGRDFHDRGPTA